MTTIGEAVLARIEALERTMTEIRSNAGTQRLVEVGEMQSDFEDLRQQVVLMRSRLESMPAPSDLGPRPPHNGTF